MGTAGHLTRVFGEHQKLCAARACRVSREAGEAADAGLRGLWGPLDPDQEGPLKSCRLVYSFPGAAGTNYHKLGVLKQ